MTASFVVKGSYTLLTLKGPLHKTNGLTKQVPSVFCVLFITFKAPTKIMLNKSFFICIYIVCEAAAACLRPGGKKQDCVIAPYTCPF